MTKNTQSTKLASALPEQAWKQSGGGARATPEQMEEALSARHHELADAQEAIDSDRERRIAPDTIEAGVMSKSSKRKYAESSWDLPEHAWKRFSRGRREKPTKMKSTLSQEQVELARADAALEQLKKNS
jgi:hypothetical protein